MKTLLLALLLAITPLVAQETNDLPARVLVVLSVKTENLPALLAAITNFNARVRTNSIAINEKAIQIKLMEARFKENYDGIPESYVGDGSVQSWVTLDKLISIWKQKEIDVAELKTKKDELQKMQ